MSVINWTLVNAGLALCCLASALAVFFSGKLVRKERELFGWLASAFGWLLYDALIGNRFPFIFPGLMFLWSAMIGVLLDVYNRE